MGQIDVKDLEVMVADASREEKFSAAKKVLIVASISDGSAGKYQQF